MAGRPDTNTTMFFDRVSCIDGKVDDNLFQLAWVDEDGIFTAIQVDLEKDRIWDQRSQHGPQVSDGGIKKGGLRRHFFSPAKCQKLCGEMRTLLDDLGNCFHVPHG